jgi:DNA-binding GntR family transcriptional regulator
MSDSDNNKATPHSEIDRIYDAIYQAIFERRLEPNTRLVEVKLAEALGGSRANVRQALLLLAQRKLVKIVPNKGALVAEPTEAEAAEVFGVRRCLEQEVVSLACLRCQPEDIDRLQRHLETEQQARREGDQHALIRLTGNFHLLLAEIAANQVLIDFLRQLIARSSLILEKYERRSSHMCNGDHHGQLVQMIAAGDRDGAQQLMDVHLREIEATLSFHRKAKPADLTEVFAPLVGAGRHR